MEVTTSDKKDIEKREEEEEEEDEEVVNDPQNAGGEVYKSIRFHLKILG